MKVPARRQGNWKPSKDTPLTILASMKVPARRRGNDESFWDVEKHYSLNESPRPKAGKFSAATIGQLGVLDEPQ